MKKVSLFVVLVAVMLFIAVPFAGAQGGPSGKVIETMNSGGYTYVHIENNGQKTWVAIPQTEVKVGQKVTFQPGMLMKNFKSKSLKRVFDVIYFSGGLAN